MVFQKELVVSTDRRFLSRPVASSELLAVVGVSTEYSDYVRVLDECENLVLLHYISTVKTVGSTETDPEPLENVGHVRGVIIDTETNKVVCRSFPYTPEVASHNPDRVRELLPQGLASAQFYSACEGTVLRVFHYNGKWHISTHRKIDAYNSYWAGPTFGSMFDETKGFRIEDLDSNLCYAFLLSHDGNRLIYKIQEPQLMLIAVYNVSESRFLGTDEYGPEHETLALNPTGCVYPTPITDIETLTDVIETVEAMEATQSFNKSGIIVMPDARNPHPLKIVNSGYASLRDARGNEPNLRSRYLQLRGTPEGGLMVQWFTEPRFQDVFDGAESEVDDLVQRLYDLYVNRYIKKDFSDLPKEEFVTIQNCHGWHTADRKNNRINKDKVREVLNTTPNHFLQRMLKRQRDERRQAERAAAADSDTTSE